MAIEWTTKKFDDLNVHELYGILRLRNDVFVLEQNCVYQDTDNKDVESFHCQGIREGELLAYARIIPPGIVYEQPSIGRVVTARNARGEGLGRKLIEVSLQFIHHHYGNIPVKIGAQVYLMEFYRSLGFAQAGLVYPEDGIDHVHMIRPFSAV